MEELQQFGLQQCGGRASLLTLRVFNYSFSRLYRRTVFFFKHCHLSVTAQLSPNTCNPVSAFSLAQCHVVVQEQRQGSLGMQPVKRKADEYLL